MFGFSWGEIGLIMAVALVAIGPKDLPVAIRTVTSMLKKARGMAAEFQGHVDEMMREANLSDVKTEINKMRQFDFKGAAEKMVDPDGALRESVADPLATTPVMTRTSMIRNASAPVVPVEEELPDSPEFIPPAIGRRQPLPAFLPPGIKRWGQ